MLKKSTSFHIYFIYELFNMICIFVLHFYTLNVFTLVTIMSFWPYEIFFF